MHERSRRRPRVNTSRSSAARASARSALRSIGLGLITGAADDDPSAIGTYAAAGALLGPAVLWLAPLTFPMMITVVYLSAKIGQVTGKGLFAVIAERYPKWLLYTVVAAVVVSDTIEAGADIGGIAAAAALLVPVDARVIVVAVAAVLIVLQVWGSYETIRNVFRWLALCLLSYVGAAVLARPDVGAVVRGTFVPTLRFDREFLAMLVAIMGTTLSAYLFTWQSNEEVEEEMALGRRRLEERRGATPSEIRATAWDIVVGMFFSNVIMFSIILATASTLHPTGVTYITTAADAAAALAPLAGRGAALLFTAGIVAVGFLAVPVMTCGAAFDLCQAAGWRHGLSRKPADAPAFYAVIVIVSVAGMLFTFAGINPMRALVVAGIVQGFTAGPLLLIMLLITRDRAAMGRWTNAWWTALAGWITAGAVFAAALALVVSAL